MIKKILIIFIFIIVTFILYFSKSLIFPTEKKIKIINVVKSDNNGKITAEISEKEFKQLLELAEGNDVNAQYEIANMYYDGLYTGMIKNLSSSRKNIDKALYWFKKAAEQNHLNAQLDLAILYEGNEKVDKNEEYSEYWYLQAAKQGNAQAMFALFNLYDSYDNVESKFKDHKKAIHWLKKSAEHDYVDAQYTLGFVYEEGELVTKDLQNSIYWYEKAAEQGDEEAKQALLRLSSLDFPKDSNK